MQSSHLFLGQSLEWSSLKPARCWHTMYRKVCGRSRSHCTVYSPLQCV